MITGVKTMEVQVEVLFWVTSGLTGSVKEPRNIGRTLESRSVWTEPKHPVSVHWSVPVNVNDNI